MHSISYTTKRTLVTHQTIYYQYVNQLFKIIDVYTLLTKKKDV